MLSEDDRWRMPMMAVSIPDTEAADLFRTWIAELEDCSE